MSETPPGLDNLKLWMKLNDTIERGGDNPQPVINEVGDNGAFYGVPEGDQSPVSISSGNPPYLNGAFNFSNDIDQYITVPDSAALSITGDLSVSFWMWKDSNASYEAIAKGETDGQRSYMVDTWENQRIVFYITPDGTQANREYCVTNTGAYSDQTWVHVVVTYDADGDSGNGFMRCYIDGTEVTFQANKTGTLPSSIHDSTEDLKVGIWVNGRYWDGKLDNIMIFNKILTQDEVNWLYNGGNGRESPIAGIARPLVGGSLTSSSLVGKGLAR